MKMKRVNIHQVFSTRLACSKELLVAITPPPVVNIILMITSALYVTIVTYTVKVFQI